MYNQLLLWKKESAGRRALLIEGARRVGKTTILDEVFDELEKGLVIQMDKYRIRITRQRIPWGLLCIVLLFMLAGAYFISGLFTFRDVNML